MLKKKRILSGMRPTGRLHLGHYTGALENWIKLQSEFESFHLIADYHVLTTNLNTDNVYDDSVQMVIDWLAAGLDPDLAPMFRQSKVKQHTELFLIFSMLITASRLERNPTIKEQVRDLNIEQVIYGHLGYPVLQSADILLYKGEFVPVGEDQVPHVEITREMSRKFNNQYGLVFPEPEPLLTKFSRLIGTDGNSKMSKSLGNAILLSDQPDEVKTKLKKAVTDPQKLRKGDPGRPEVCVVYSYHERFNASETDEIGVNCRSGALGCVDCKTRCSARISEFLDPMLQKRAYYETNMNKVLEIISDGEKAANEIAENTMREVREHMKLG